VRCTLAIFSNVPIYLSVFMYVGTVHVFLKDSIFEASSPTRHTAELGILMKKMSPSAVAVVMYTDGGPKSQLQAHFGEAWVVDSFYGARPRHNGGHAHSPYTKLGQSRGKSDVGP
jgi:hypothetical protein